jgi:hypothetical protein
MARHLLVSIMARLGRTQTTDFFALVGHFSLCRAKMTNKEIKMLGLRTS